jgi:RNA polymerase sigma factor (TIGR02999 family)
MVVVSYSGATFCELLAGSRMNHEPSLQVTTTELIETAEAGSSVGVDRLFPLVYDELKILAHRRLLDERRQDSMQTTALVHEVYLKLVDDARVTQRGRGYFFAAASRAMRQILVDRARRRLAVKRGEGVDLVSLEEDHAAVDAHAAEVLALDDALTRLAEWSPRHARVVELRYFAGLSVSETSATLGVSPRTVKSDWAMARAWLFRELGGQDTKTPPTPRR